MGEEKHHEETCIPEGSSQCSQKCTTANPHKVVVFVQTPIILTQALPWDIERGLESDDDKTA